MKIVLLALAVGVPAIFWWMHLDRVRDTYSSECPGPSSTAPPDDWSSAKGPMKDQSALLLSWGFVALGGIIALVTTKSVHRFKWIPFLYLLLAPALSLLAGSLWAAVLFQRRLAFLELSKCPAGGTLNDLLMAQSNLLLYAVGGLALFTLICLWQIITGRVDPRRKE